MFVLPYRVEGWVAVSKPERGWESRRGDAGGVRVRAADRADRGDGVEQEEGEPARYETPHYHSCIKKHENHKPSLATTQSNKQ